MPMDRSKYPENWPEISFAVRERANWTCQNCAKQCRRPEEPFDTHIRTLTVSHVDHDPANCDPGNLVALCAPCHLRYDAKHHAANARLRRAREAGQLTFQL